MASLNKIFVTWITRSINKHFDDRRESVPLYVEGQSGTIEQTNYTLRIYDMVFEVHAQTTFVDFTINLLVKTLINDTSIYALEDILGAAASIFTGIEILNYPSTTVKGCAKLTSKIITKKLGQLDPKIPIQYSTVEASYQVELVNGTD